MKNYLLASTAFALTLWGMPAAAQDSLQNKKAALEEMKELLTLELDIEKAENDLIKAKNDKLKTKLGLDELPKFENKTELINNGGEIEAALLTSTAVEKAASLIKDEIVGREATKKTGIETTKKKGNFLVLTGAARVDFNLPVILMAELQSVKYQFGQIPGIIQCPTADSQRALPDGAIAGGGIGAAVSVITALSGLLGTETTVTGFNVGVEDNQLATALAGELVSSAANVRLYHHDIGRLSLDQLNKSDINKKIGCLQSLRQSAADIRKKKAAKKKQSDSDKAALAQIDVIAARFDTLYTQIAKRGDDGYSTFAKAVLFNQYTDEINDYKVVRVKADKSGGSLVHNKNIWTTFGIDPLKVSGGLLVSYSVINRSGNVEKAGRLACQTSLASLRKIQSGKWRNSIDEGRGIAVCR